MSEFGTPDGSHLDNIIQGPQNWNAAYALDPTHLSRLKIVGGVVKRQAEGLTALAAAVAGTAGWRPWVSRLSLASNRTMA